jgi:hypothetical protein
MASFVCVVGIYTHELLFEGLLVLHISNTFQNPS